MTDGRVMDMVENQDDPYRDYGEAMNKAYIGDLEREIEFLRQLPVATPEAQAALDRLRIWRGFQKYEAGQPFQNWELMQAVDAWLDSEDSTGD